MITIYKRPIKVTGKTKNGTYYCAAFTRKGTMNTLQLAKQMGESSSSFTKGEISGVTIDLPTGIKQALLSGQAVTINGLGTFKPSIRTSDIKENKDDLTASLVSIAGLNFKPDTELLDALNREATFEFVSAEKADDEDKEDDDTSSNSQSGTTQSGGTTDSDGVTEHDD